MHAIDRKIVGTYGQIQEVSQNHKLPNSIYHYQEDDGRFRNDVVWPVYRMEPDAKLTDLIRNIPLGVSLMISEKSLRYFETLRLPQYQIFPLNFVHNADQHSNYFAFSIVKNKEFFDFISWTESRFYKTSNFHKELIEEFILNSVEEFFDYKKVVELSGYGFWPKLKLKFNKNYDLINFGQLPFPTGYFCGEKLKRGIEESGLTGYAFKEYPNDFFS